MEMKVEVAQGLIDGNILSRCYIKKPQFTIYIEEIKITNNTFQLCINLNTNLLPFNNAMFHVLIIHYESVN